jgi:hypothetical protein
MSEDITTKRKFDPDPENFKGRSLSAPGAQGVTSVEIEPIGRVQSLPVTDTDMPEEKRQAKIAEFEEWFIHFIEELEELQTVDNSLPGMSAALPILTESIDPEKAESELLRDRIMSSLAKDEEKAANAFGMWLVRKDNT